MTPDKWIKVLLNSRDLERPDGRMLYGYRLSNEEYKSLREMLAYTADFGELDEVSSRIRGFAALFVLYAAEWWRREYQGGAWRWTSIISAFGGNAKELDAAARTKCVISGFAFWGHRPDGEGKKFFGAIVAHGGLPLKFIGHGGGKLASIMDYTLRLAARYHWDSLQIVNAIEERAEEFPAASLRCPEIYQLIASMVVAVLELKQEFHLAGIADPVAVLNTQEPSWRLRFPLSLEDAAAQALLSGLVKEAAQQLMFASSVIFSVERMLRKTADGKYELASALACPQTLATGTLAELFGLNELPRYFSIDVQVNERKPFCEGRQVLGADTATVSLAGGKCVWHGVDACSEHLLHLRGQSGDLRENPLPIPGGAELSQDGPWVFVLRDGKLRWVAAGSARVPEEEAVVALPDGWDIEAANADSIADFVGHCHLGDQQIALYSVQGEITLTEREQHYRIRTKQATSASDTYVWEGRRIAYPSSPQPVFIGVPKLFRYPPEGERSRVPAAELHWFAAGTNIRLEDTNTAQGPIDVYLVRDGEQQTRFRFIVLDSLAHTNFLSGASASEGIINLEGWGCSDVSIDDQLELHCRIEQAGRGVKLFLQAGDVPPESVNVAVRWQRCARELRLKLPFPSAGGRFFDAKEKPLRDGDEIALRHLTGARLRIFDRNPQAPKKYDVSLALDQHNRKMRSADLIIERPILLLPNGSAEVRLIDLQNDIEKLMSFSDELDATVVVAVLVGSRPTTSVRVSRYETMLERDSLAVFFPPKVIKRLDMAALEKIIVRAAPLTSLDGECVQLDQEYSEGVPAACWQAAGLNAAYSPWLIFPDDASSVFFRPTIWGKSVDSPEMDTNSGCPLAQAMAIREAEARMEAIAAILDAMATDFNHPSWQVMEYLLETFHHLPLSSLDVFRLIGVQPTAAVSLLLRSQFSEDRLFEFARRLRDELGLVWELASIDIWRNAASKLYQYWVATLGEDDAKASFPIILKARLDRLAGEHPSLQLMLDVLLMELTNHPSDALVEVQRVSQGDRLAFAYQLWRGHDSLAQNLLFRGHANDAEWPERPLFEAAFTGFLEVVADSVKNKLNPDIVKKMFWMDTPKDFKVSVANIPVLCALWAVTGTSQEWWRKPEHRLALRKIKAFDPIWFEQAFGKAVAACLALGILVPSEGNAEKSLIVATD
jgi:hypothetical protein